MQALKTGSRLLHHPRLLTSIIGSILIHVHCRRTCCMYFWTRYFWLVWLKLKFPVFLEKRLMKEHLTELSTQHITFPLSPTPVLILSGSLTSICPCVHLAACLWYLAGAFVNKYLASWRSPARSQLYGSHPSPEVWKFSVSPLLI